MIKKRTALPLFIVSIFFLFQTALAMADYRETELIKTDPESKAHGNITMEPIGFVRSDRLLRVNVYGLSPNTLYDVWIVDRDTGKRSPAGFEGENTFRTNAGGSGHFVDRTTEYVLGWNKLEVSAHKEGESAENLKDVDVLLWVWMYQ